jgi:hypothetical protein
MPGIDEPMPEGIPIHEAAPEKVTLPPTEAERKKLHLASVEKEDDDSRYKRRAGEYQVLLGTHFENVNNAHASYPTRNILWEDMDEDEQRRWNEKRLAIDSANRAYHLAVNQAFNGHAEEDAHLARVAVTNKIKGDI